MVRMAQLQIPDHVIRHIASREGVCTRPVLRRVSDRVTGESVVRALDCGSTLESRCPACAAKARRLRILQCTEGWHLAEEPQPLLAAADDEEATAEADNADDGADGLEDDQHDQDAEGGAGSRRVRSTRRLEGMPDLPQQEIADRTVGTVFTAPDGKTYRPSMFVTLTLDSYGRIRPGQGVPARPERYDYRRAALDALHFPKLMDRWFQNLRRAPATGCSTSAPSKPRCASPRTSTSPSAVRSPAPPSGPSPRPPTSPCGGPRWSTPSTSSGTPVWADGQLPRPRHRLAAAHLGASPGRVDEDPTAEPAHVVTFGTPGRRQGHPRRHEGLRPGRALPDQVPHQGRRRNLRRRRRPEPGLRGAHRPAPRPDRGGCRAPRAARTGCATAPNPRTPAPAWSPATAPPRPTTANTSASAAAASWSPVAGPARPSPSTGPTAAPSSSRS